METRNATKKHALLLKDTARPEDRKAMRAAGSWADPRTWARAQMNRSVEVHAFYEGDEFMGLAGVIELPRQPGRPLGQFLWTACDPRCLSFEFVDGLRNRHSLLLMMIHGQDPALLESAQAAGFSLMAPAPFGTLGDLFVKCALDTRKIEVVHAGH